MRFVWLWLVLGIGSGLIGQAQERSKDSHLTSQEITSGWVSLFDGETMFGWQPRGDAKWQVADGTIQVSEGGAGMLATTTEFADFELQAECWIDDKANSGIFLRCPMEGTIDSENAYEVNVYDPHKKWPTGSINNVARTRTRVKSVGKWSLFSIRAEGDKLSVMVDGKRTVMAKDTKHARGVLALQYNGAGTVRFRNIKLRPLTLKSLFNGKDLTGWKEISGHKSVFSVTPEGWLNIKNGNGEIQSTSQWGDLTLQMDIYSNGDHLNSGIFYREDLDKFWLGYECQIRNQWEGDDRTKAVDYGTGGIYNRQPARKVVSSDRQWFMVTLVASGNHHAAWVDGYQVSDYVDTRSEDQNNARNGARTRAGCIGLQGHDPTTDLSFRNIRIMELPAKGH